MQFMSRRRFIEWTLANTGIIGSVGCGTVLHPERRGQPSGPLDWGIVALDAVGLLLFFVPGVIAFAVDFSNGTIYLPPDRYGRNHPERKTEELIAVQIQDERVRVQSLEEIVSKHADEDIRLVPGTYQTEELGSLADFWEATDKLANL